MNNTLVFITDDKYVMPTIVAIKSVEEAAMAFNKKYDIHVCAFNLSSENIDIFYSMDSLYLHIHICIIEKKAYDKKMSMVSQNSHVTPTALLKFELPNIFKELDKILYLDSDIIVKGDLSELLNIELGSNYVAASYEFWKFLLDKYEYKKNNTTLPFYFNSGVMLLNLKKMREDNISDKLWECKIHKYSNTDSKKFALMDQDVLNEIFEQKSVRLPNKYNCNCKFVNDKYVEDINKVYHTRYGSADDIYRDAVIIHYVGKEDKPWIYQNAALVELWDQYYKKTCYEAEELNRIIYEKNLQYYFKALKKSIASRGMKATIKYILNKR